MSEINRIDFVGFTFNGKHSSELGIVRTSEGSRFNENLLPTIQDKTVQVPGGDGTYHFGSYFTQKQFNISYAFDELTEEQLQELKRVFGDKQVHDLIFDEAPYKIYKAKVTGSASIKHIPFSEGETNRVYKGEGSFQFTAYDPYARSRYKYLNQYNSTNIPNWVDNKVEWKAAANLLDQQGTFDVKTNTNEIKLYNPGDKESDFILTFSFNSSHKVPAGGINIGADYQLNFNSIDAQGGPKDYDDQIKINTKLNLIEGYKNGKKTGRIYNDSIESGDFFKIPVTTDKTSPLKMIIDNDKGLAAQFVDIEYNYQYI